MATYTRVSGDYNIVSIDPTVDNVNVTTSSLNVTGNLNVAGNITYITVESFTVDDPFITIAGNNSGSLGTAPYQEQGIVTRTSGSTYAGIRFDNGTQEWQISDSVYSNGAPITSYVAISTYTDADVAAYLPTYTGNISAGNISITGNLLAGNLNSNAAVTGVTGVFSGNVTANYFLGNGSQITGISITSLGNSTSNVVSVASGNITTSAGGTPNVFVVTPTGANVAGNLAVTGNITGGNISTTGNISGNTNGFTIGYLNIPQVPAGNVTLALTDAGKHYYSTTAGDLTLTIPTNANVGFDTGTAISIVVQAVGNVLVETEPGVTLYLAGNTTSGNRVVGTYGMATVMKVASDTWFINGTSVT